ncbi:MAG: transposase family protein [Proteobacteria bacterium]|nr:transposase family protein [Pseudomonadota bacterium]
MAYRGREIRRMAGLLQARLPELELETLEDPRNARGKRWKLSTLLRTALVGMMAGCTSLSQVEMLTQQMSRSMRRRLGIAGRVADTTLRDLLCRLQVYPARCGRKPCAFG